MLCMAADIPLMQLHGAAIPLQHWDLHGYRQHAWPESSALA